MTTTPTTLTTTTTRTNSCEGNESTMTSSSNNSKSREQNLESSNIIAFDTGVFAYKKFAGISQPANPLVGATPVNTSNQPNEQSVGNNANGSSSSNTCTVGAVPTCSKMHDHLHGQGESQSNVDSGRFRYAYNNDGIFIVNVTVSQDHVPTRLIKVEPHDPGYRAAKRKRHPKVSVKVKSEDSTDSE